MPTPKCNGNGFVWLGYDGSVGRENEAAWVSAGRWLGGLRLFRVLCWAFKFGFRVLGLVKVVG